MHPQNQSVHQGPKEQSNTLWKKVISVRWIDINKGDAFLQNYRPRLVARENKERQQARLELLAAQGLPQDVGGYYQPVAELADKAMRPSGTLNAILNAIGA